MKTLALTFLLCSFIQPLKSDVYPEVLFECTIIPKEYRAGKLLIEATNAQNVLIIFAKFAGEAPFDNTAPSYAEDILDPDVPGSLSHFYSTMSSGAFTIKGSFLGKRYSSNSKASDYVSETSETGFGDFGRFALEVLQNVDQDPSIDFGDYDNDGPDGIPNSGDDDGFVDFIIISLMSRPIGFISKTATGALFLGFSHTFTTDDESASGGFIKIFPDNGAIARTFNFSHAVGTMAHEYGHKLGISDYYDTSFLRPKEQSPKDDSAGIGAWGIMGTGTLGWNENDGPNPFCAYSLEQLGWIGKDNDRLIELNQDISGMVVEPFSSGGNIYKIRLSQTEYLLLANRRNSVNFYDRNIPGSGLLIWHVNTAFNGNSDESRKVLDLECADGLYFDAGFPLGKDPDRINGKDNLDFWAHDEEYAKNRGGNLGDSTDPFDGIRFTSLRADTNPSSLQYEEVPAVVTDFRKNLVELTIRRSGANILIDMSIEKDVYFGHLSGSSVLWTGEVKVGGDIEIDRETLLQIEPKTEIRFARSDVLGSGTDPQRCEIIVRGKMKADNALFTSEGPNPEKGDWYGIVVGRQGTVTLRSSTVEYSQFGLTGQFPSGLSFISSVVRNTSRSGIDLQNSRKIVVIVDSVVEGSGGKGVVISGPSYVLINSTTISGNAQGGTILSDCSSEIQNSTFSKNGEGAEISIQRGKNSIIERNNISGKTGVEVSQTPLLLIRNNTFQNSNVGIASASSSTVISKNTFLNIKEAIVIESGKVSVELNAFVDNGKNVRNLSKSPISANFNWWGTSDPHDIRDKLEGPVDWSIFLMSDPTVLDIPFALEQNFPNPFNSTTIIHYQIPATTSITRGGRALLVIYDILGQKVKTLVDEDPLPGFHSVFWDARDDKGRKVSSGVYFYRLTVAQFLDTKKLLLLK